MFQSYLCIKGSYLQRGTIVDQSHVCFIIHTSLLSVNMIQMKQASVVKTEMASVYTPMLAWICNQCHYNSVLAMFKTT